MSLCIIRGLSPGDTPKLLCLLSPSACLLALSYQRRMLAGTVGMRCRFISLWTCCDVHRKTELVILFGYSERSLIVLSPTMYSTRFQHLTSLLTLHPCFFRPLYTVMVKSLFKLPSSLSLPPPRTFPANTGSTASRRITRPSSQTSLLSVSTPTPHVFCKHKVQLHPDGS